MNGHQITSSYHTSSGIKKLFCDECGAKTIIACPECKAEILGHKFISGVIGLWDTSVPEFCHNCGKPYPWTKNKTMILDALYQNNGQDSLLLIENICKKFHLVVKQLRSRYGDRSTLDVIDEYDVQNLLHILLILFFDDIRTEEWTPSYAGCASRIDFVLKNEGIAIETKMTRNGLNARKLGDQLIIDIDRYKKYNGIKSLFCFVYDPEGRIVNPQGIEKELSRDIEGFTVKLLIVPKGY